MTGELLGSAGKFITGQEITPNEGQDFLPVR
jgi:hypothetical protein